MLELGAFTIYFFFNFNTINIYLLQWNLFRQYFWFFHHVGINRIVRILALK